MDSRAAGPDDGGDLPGLGGRSGPRPELPSPGDLETERGPDGPDSPEPSGEAPSPGRGHGGNGRPRRAPGRRRLSGRTVRRAPGRTWRTAPGIPQPAPPRP